MFIFLIGFYVAGMELAAVFSLDPMAVFSFLSVLALHSLSLALDDDVVVLVVGLGNVFYVCDRSCAHRRLIVLSLLNTRWMTGCI